VKKVRRYLLCGVVAACRRFLTYDNAQNGVLQNNELVIHLVSALFIVCS